MFKVIIQSINRIMFFFNALCLVLLLAWSLAGIWEFFPTDNILFWKVLISLIAILLFNVLSLFCLAYLYKRTESIVDVFTNSEHVSEYKEGAVIFDEGQVQKIMYVLIKGQVKISTDNQVLEIIHEGEIFGEMAIIEDLPRTATAVCLTDCKLIMVNEKHFYELLQEVPFFAKEVMRTISHRLRIQDHNH